MSDYTISKNDYNVLNKKIRIAFVVSEFNREHTKALEETNEKFLINNWFEKIEKYLVPWALEIPAFVKLLQLERKFDLIICLGVIVRWETTHYDIVAWESARWLMDLSIKYANEFWLINWILTCENEEQVKARIKDSYAISWLNLLLARKNTSFLKHL